MNLPSIKNSAFAPSNNSLEDVLIELERYGEPMLLKMKKGWLSKVEVFVTGKGTSFDVRSDYRRTPHDAASECYDRLMLAIKLIKESK